MEGQATIKRLSLSFRRYHLHKIKNRGAILNQGEAIIAGIDGSESKKILILEMLNIERSEAYDRMFKSLKKRGLYMLKKIKLSDNIFN